MAEFILQHLMEDTVYTDTDGRSALAKIQVSSGDRSCLNPEQAVPSPTNFDLCQTMELEEALRLLGVYHEVFGILHPFLNMATLRRQANVLWGALQPVPSSQPTLYPPSQDNHVVKLAIAIALLCESGGSHPTATAIYQSMQVIVVQSVLGLSFELGRLVLLVLIVWIYSSFMSSRILLNVTGGLSLVPGRLSTKLQIFGRRSPTDIRNWDAEKANIAATLSSEIRKRNGHFTGLYIHCIRSPDELCCGFTYHVQRRKYRNT